MSNLFKYILAFILLSSCQEHKTKFLDSNEVMLIDIKNESNNINIHFLKRVLEDRYTIRKIVKEINNLILVNDMDIKNSFGLFDVVIKSKGGNNLNYWIVYTKYNGVVIVTQDKSNNRKNQYYKNDFLEQLVLSQFLNPN
jgi:hypothetical protein